MHRRCIKLPEIFSDIVVKGIFVFIKDKQLLNITNIKVGIVRSIITPHTCTFDLQEVLSLVERKEVEF